MANKDEIRNEVSDQDRVAGLTGKMVHKSCLILQIAVYFNIYFSPIYFLTFYLSYQRFGNELKEMEDFLTKAVLIIGSIIELPRLFLGYTGNYAHRVSYVLCFWLVTSFIQLPVQVLLRASPLTEKPFLSVVNIVMIIFLIFEIISTTFVFRWLLGIIPKIKQN